MSLGWIVALVLALVVLGALAFGVAWLRRHPSALPYSQRALLLPAPFLSTARLLRALKPEPGERLLEIGPGKGRHAIAVARRIAPGGSLEVADVHPEWIEHTTARAREAGVEGISGTVADACRLPYENASFDGVYMITVLGETSRQEEALREALRVLRPGGRLVVGESVFDPHFVAPGSLRARAEEVGLRFDYRLGPAAIGFLAHLRRG